MGDRAGHSIAPLLPIHLEEKFEVQKKEIISLKTEINNLKRDNSENEGKIEKLEQYTRRNSLRIFGLKEERNENLQDKVLQFFKNQLQEEVKVEHVDRVHRVGKFKVESTRAIIIKFVSYQQRALVFRKKKMLKGSGVTVKEDLTVYRVGVLKAAEKKYGYRNVWTMDGRIFVSEDNKILVISSFEDLK